MIERSPQDKREDDSSLDDVRRVREELSERFGNDIRKLGEYASLAAEQAQRELGCPIVHKADKAPASAKG